MPVAEEAVDLTWTELPHPPIVEAKVESVKLEPSDTVTMKVLSACSSFGFDDRGFFEKGEVFTVSRKRAERFPKKYVEIVE